MTLREVAAQSELSALTVMAAHRAHQAGGWPAVNVKPRGRKSGDGSRLGSAQEEGVQRLICDKIPDQLKLGLALWNRQAVAQLIRDEYGIALPIRTVGAKIEAFYLSSCSLELNPDECLNVDLKDGVTRRVPARSKAQLKQAVISHLRKLRKSPQRMRNHFKRKPIRYAP